MQSDNPVLQSNCCHSKRLTKTVYSCLLPSNGVAIGGSSKRFFRFYSNPQSGLANEPMSGLNSYTDAILLTTPMAAAFLSDCENEQHKLTLASSPRNGRSIEGIRRSACSSPSRMAEFSVGQESWGCSMPVIRSKSWQTQQKY